MFKILDAGIAACFAAKIARDFGCDNRVFYSFFPANQLTLEPTEKSDKDLLPILQKLKLIDADIVCGIPLAVASKNPFFDRSAFWSKEAIDQMVAKLYPAVHTRMVGLEKKQE